MVSNAHINGLLPADTKKLFKVIGPAKVSAHYIDSRFGEINFRTLTVVHAEYLVKKEANFIIRKPIKKEESKISQA